MCTCIIGKRHDVINSEIEGNVLANIIYEYGSILSKITIHVYGFKRSICVFVVNYTDGL